MKRPIESSPNHENGPPLGTKKASEIQPPNEPCIGLTDTGPINPAKFQRFMVPLEFIRKANALDLANLETDDDSDSSGTAADRIAAAAESAKPSVPNSGAAPPPPAMPPPLPKALQEPTKRTLIGRRPVGVFTPFAFRDQVKTRIKIQIAVVFAILILWWSLLRRGTPPTVPDESATVSPTVSSVALPAIRDVPIAASVKKAAKQGSNAPTNLNTRYPPVTEVPSAATLLPTGVASKLLVTPILSSGATVSTPPHQPSGTGKRATEAADSVNVEPTAPWDTPTPSGKRPLLVPR